MRRTGRVLFIFFILLSSMAGLWLFQSWREAKKLETKQQFQNVYITSVSGTTISAVWGEEEKTWESVSEVQVEGIADVELMEGKVVKITKKPEEITGKILNIKEQTITLEEYGEIPLHPDFVVYHRDKSGKIHSGNLSELTVGSVSVRFVVAGKEICAAVMEEEELENIRVLLKNNDGTSYDMDKVVVTADTDYTVKQKGNITAHKKGEKITFSRDNTQDTVVISTGDKGKLQIEGLKRQQGVPWYRGDLELTGNEKGIRVINEVSLEEYLYSVVPSEMPTEYSPEALKAQAICARTYAVQQMKNHRLAKEGAHVDDSISFQVYNNLKEDEKAIQAVQATKNQVVTYENKVVTTYFFSASCGSTSGMKDVWFTKKDVSYLPAQIQTMPQKKQDLSSEETFKSFMKKSIQTVDNTSPWYRWETTISAKEIKKTLEENITKRYEVNKTQIQTRNSDGNWYSTPVDTVGDIKNITIKKRGCGGVVSMIEIEGSKNTIQVYTEYNIRLMLAGKKTIYKRQDKQEVTGLSLLPSGFFYMDKKGDSYVFHGGGYGHGVGMSQNGANTMAKQGENCQDILTFYFPGTTVQERQYLSGKK